MVNFELNNEIIAKQNLINTWLEIAQNNVWISQRGSYHPEDDCAFEDPLCPKDFYECYTIQGLYNQLVKGNALLGQPFYYKNLCFINQINAGDEWLVIRDDLEFESLTASAMGYENFKHWVECILNTTNEQLRNLEYTTDEYKIRRNRF
jgi:hypothetical protein